MEKNKSKTSSAKNIFSKIILLLISSVIFWLARPNIFFEDGLSLLAWINYLPVLFLIKKSRLFESLIYGSFYGVISYGLFGYWLQAFHPLGLIIVCLAYMLICALLFFLLKYADLICNKNGWLLQFFIICGYEYIKTLGFLGLAMELLPIPSGSLFILFKSAL
jgi:apolipoprotein N-acyltransferase